MDRLSGLAHERPRAARGLTDGSVLEATGVQLAVAGIADDERADLVETRLDPIGSLQDPTDRLQ
jgi:hypothetical protein